MRPVHIPTLFNRQAPFAQPLTTAGDGTGATSFTADYSSANITPRIEPPAGEVYKIYSLGLLVRATAALSSDSYGSTSALSTGVVLRIVNPTSTLVTLATGITTLAQWSASLGIASVVDFGNQTVFNAVAPFAALYGEPIVLNGDADEALEVLLQDDFTGNDLAAQIFTARGRKSVGY